MSYDREPSKSFFIFPIDGVLYMSHDDDTGNLPGHETEGKLKMTAKKSKVASDMVDALLEAGLDPNSAIARRVRAGEAMVGAMTECGLDVTDRVILCALYISSVGECLGTEGRRTLAELAISTMVEPWGMQAMAMTADDVLKAAADTARSDKPAN